MNKLALALAMAALLAGAAEAQTSQQNRMGACNGLAGERSLSGDARKSFMSDCLSKGPEAMAAPAKPGQGSQQQRMADCNAAASAGNVKGDARKAFMSDCLKGGGTTAAKEQACTAQADAKKLSGAARTSFVKKSASS
ncbi:MAG: PsiF family protein [Geminicoccaceae bacterium]